MTAAVGGGQRGPTGDSGSGGPNGPNGFVGPLSASVAGLCRALIPRVSPRTAVGFDDVLRRLAAPLQVAVAGRIKSGKSTLVNALIGRRVAPTDIGECTRLVTRFQYGTVDRLEVVFKNARRQVLPFATDGMIPANLGVDITEVSHIEAYLTNALLRDMTVIDTPGLGSLDSASVSRTEELLGTAQPEDADTDSGANDGLGELDDTSRLAVAGAEAVLYVVTQGARMDDQEALSAFTAATAGRAAGPVNAIAVLNKVDTIVPESVAGASEADDPVWTAATILARKQADVLKPKVADVLPMIGLLAESAESGAFTGIDADALRQLAKLDEETLSTMLISADIFATWDTEVPAGVRIRLLEKLDLHGIRNAVSAIQANPAIIAGELRRRLLELSGLAAVRAKLAAVFAARADGIKATAALSAMFGLARASGDSGELQRVRDGIEQLLATAQAHQLRLLDALTLVASEVVTMPEDLLDEVLRVGSNTEVGAQLGMADRDRAEQAAFALERAGWWRSFASFGATPAQSRIAHVIHRAYFLIWQSLRESPGAARR